MFISLIQRVSMLQVTKMLLFTGDQGRKIIEGLYPPLETPASPISDEIFQAPSFQITRPSRAAANRPSGECAGA